MIDMTLPVYDIASPTKSDNSEVDTISLVDMPAIESDFVAMSDNKEVKYVTFKANADKQILYGAVLIPDKLIYRNDESGEYYLRWTADVIEQFQQQFSKAENNNKINYQHKQGKYIDAYVAESWIVMDTNNDKSNSVGLSLPKGTWVAGVKVDNKKFWDYYIKKGKLKGFSVEAFVNTVKVDKPHLTKQKPKEQVKQKSNFSMFIDKVKGLFQSSTSKKITLSAIMMADGTDWQMDDATYAIIDAQGNVPADGRYDLADGTSITVQGGVVTEYIMPMGTAPTEQTSEDVEQVAETVQSTPVAQGKKKGGKVKVQEIETTKVEQELEPKEDLTAMLADTINELRKELAEVKQTLSKASIAETPKTTKAQTVEQGKTNPTESAISQFLNRK